MASTGLIEQAASVSMKEADEKLAGLTRNSLTELCAFNKSPKACELIFEGVSILLQPSKKKFEWTDAKKMISQTTSFPQTLLAFDKNSITNDQLERLTTILAQDECQPERVLRISSACHILCIWLRAVVDYTKLHQQTQ